MKVVCPPPPPLKSVELLSSGTFEGVIASVAPVPIDIFGDGCIPSRNGKRKQVHCLCIPFPLPSNVSIPVL